MAESGDPQYLVCPKIVERKKIAFEIISNLHIPVDKQANVRDIDVLSL